MKVGLLGTGFGIAHARIYHIHPQVSSVVVFGRTPAKLQAFADEFGYATTTDPASIYDDPTIDLIDVCLPTTLHADHVTQALDAGKHVLCELPLTTTMADAHRVVDAAAARAARTSRVSWRLSSTLAGLRRDVSRPWQQAITWSITAA